jgi:hypothetical protein
MRVSIPSTSLRRSSSVVAEGAPGRLRTTSGKPWAPGPISTGYPGQAFCSVIYGVRTVNMQGISTYYKNNNLQPDIVPSMILFMFVPYCFHLLYLDNVGFYLIRCFCFVDIQCI